MHRGDLDLSTPQRHPAKSTLNWFGTPPRHSTVTPLAPFCNVSAWLPREKLLRHQDQATGGWSVKTPTPTNGPDRGPTHRPTRRRPDSPCDGASTSSAEGLPSLSLSLSLSHPARCFVVGDRSGSSMTPLCTFSHYIRQLLCISTGFRLGPPFGRVGCRGGLCPPHRRTLLHVVRTRQSRI